MPRGSARQQFARWLEEEVVAAPLVPVLHPSPLRMRGLGLFMLVGHPLFLCLWTTVLPQPYESTVLRLLGAALGLLLMSPYVSREPASRVPGLVFSAVVWFELPFFFCWMYLCNGGSEAWLASVAAMILAYYFVTDWRIATVGLLAAAGLSRVLFEFWGPFPPAEQLVFSMGDAVVITSCVTVGLLLGLSSVNLRREHLAHTLTTMGIMAHELRTPLATMSLIGDAVRGAGGDGADPERLQQLAARLHTLVRNMNHQIDMQITNARLTRLPGHTEAVSAADLVREAVGQYPYRSQRERESVKLQLLGDFRFRGSRSLFSRVLDNLIKNSLRSLAAASNSQQPGDLILEVSHAGNKGRIVVADRGAGIAPHLQPRIFEPFFSTNHGTGHGLGLAFCRRVVEAAQGTIGVISEPGRGAIITIELPALR